MKRWMFLGYLVVEIAAFWAMGHFLGWAWAIVITIAAGAVGFAVLGRRAREIITAARTPAPEGAGPGRTLTDSALFAGAALLTILPGVVSTLLGLILLAPPIRRRLRPVVAAAATRRATVFAQRVTIAGMTPNGYVDGTVVDDGRAEGSVIVDMTVRNPDGTIRHDLPALPPAKEF
ncbi:MULTISPECIES: FxsA family protein [unclassified Gordonia (in: high G+C Gram-positive bacteria)]|uniref:FxsA family protein n=1 Tax=unclassified Gordonia (in: high G+C Gram-positive bacteria) TaxID=2657482 RepID=UPI001FFF83B5|nr:MULTISPECIES: FxsA family protein [unclassified Gordonia (in: high G+C Gram-positive bacteria)]UQE76768.1 FxsA family protein [Gordonia sp. PP30]